MEKDAALASRLRVHRQDAGATQTMLIFSTPCRRWIT